MSECAIHQLTFGPVGPVQPRQHCHVVEDTTARVVDLVCPDCGAKLFVYYRTVPGRKNTYENQKEGNEK